MAWGGMDGSLLGGVMYRSHNIRNIGKMGASYATEDRAAFSQMSSSSRIIPSLLTSAVIGNMSAVFVAIMSPKTELLQQDMFTIYILLFIRHFLGVKFWGGGLLNCNILNTSACYVTKG